MDHLAGPKTTDYQLLQQARALWSEGQRDAALEQFELAVTAQPDNVRALVEAARSFGQCYQIERAESLLSRATTLAGSDPQIAPLIAQSYQYLHRPLRAIAAFQELQRAHRLPAPLLAELAVQYEQTNQLDKALAAIEQCISQSPRQAEPRFVMARIQRERGNPQAAESILNELQNRVDASPLLRVRIYAEQCHLLDASEDYDGAISAIEEAKQILRRTRQATQLARRRTAINHGLRQLFGDFNQTVLEQWRNAALPTHTRCSNIAHLLGFPRSGTTLLEQIVAAHPMLVTSSERPIFARDIFPAMYRASGTLTLASLQSICDQQLDRLRCRYVDAMEAILGEPLGGRVHVDKNPNHTSLILGLLRLFPKSKFLFAVRDPRDVIVSTFLRFFPLTEFSVAFLDWDSLCEQYAYEMECWFSVRKLLNDQSLQVRYEDLVQDWQSQAESALQLLGLRWHPSVADYRKRLQEKVVNSPSQAAVRRPIYSNSVGRWQHYKRYLEPYLGRLEPYCQALGYR